VIGRENPRDTVQELIAPPPRVTDSSRVWAQDEGWQGCSFFLELSGNVNLVNLSEKQGAVSQNERARHSNLSQMSSLRLEVFEPVIGQGHSSKANFRITG
jgi:hypothetical protein